MTPRVSIVLPCYNAAEHLPETLASLSAQTLSDFECIAIDDGSSDTTRAVLEAHAAQDPRFIVLSRENRGLIATLNQGIALARGEWIARMDADDIAHPTRLEKQLAHAEQIGADICGCWIRFFGDRQGEWHMPVENDAIRVYLMFNSPLAHPTVLARTRLMVSHPYDPANQHAEDYGLWCTLALAGARFANVPEVLLDYRTHAGQITQSRAAAVRASAQQSRTRYITAALPPSLNLAAPRLIELAEPGRTLSAEECLWLFDVLLQLRASLTNVEGLGTIWLDALQRTPDAGWRLVRSSSMLAQHYPLPDSETTRYRRLIVRCLMGKWLRDRLRK
jgi:hypothetical protein